MSITFKLHFNLQILLIGFDPEKMLWQEYLVFVWVLTFLLEQMGMVRNWNHLLYSIVKMLHT